MALKQRYYKSILESEEGIILSVTLKMVWFPKDEENNNKGKK